MSSEVAELERPSHDLPAEWQQTTLGGAIAKSEGGGTPPRDVEEYWNGDIPWASVKDVVKGEGSTPEETITPAGLANSTSKLIAAGTNIFAARMGVGAVVRYPFPVAINQDLMALTPSSKLDPGYLFYWLQARKEAFVAVATGTTVKGIRKDVLLSFPMVLPPLDEQRRIAEVLRSVDEAIAAKQAALSASKLFKHTCREAAVTRFQHHAPSRLQSVLASIDAGWSPDCESEPANDGEWSILKTSAVVWQGYDDAENKRLPAHLEPRPHLEVVADDILITRAGPAERTGVIAIVRETAGRRMLSDKIIRLRVDRDKAVPLAIAELLSSEHVQAELIRSKSGMAASQTNISQKIVLGLEIHLPPLSEQQDFAEEMAALQDAIETGEADLQTTRQLKAALMSDLLSGRVRVPA